MWTRPGLYITTIEQEIKFFYNRSSDTWFETKSKATDYKNIFTIALIGLEKDMKILKEKFPDMDLQMEEI